MGACLGGIGSLSYVLMLEFSPTSYRGVVSVWMNAMFAVGILCLVPVAYLLRDQHYSADLLVESIPGLLMLCFYPCVDESPRWLALHDQHTEAEAVLRSVEGANGSRVVLEPLEEASTARTVASPNGAQVSLLDGARKILRPSLRAATVSLFFCWFIVTLVYYGLAFSADALSGDVYTNSILLALVEFPAYIALHFSMDHPRIGRRGSQLASFALAGIALLLIAAFPDGPIELVLAMIGKLGATAAFVVVYVFAGELFPTDVRGTGLGCCNVFARLGGILAPQILNLPTSVALLMFGALSAAAGFLTLGLTETLGQPLKDVMDEDAAGDVVGQGGGAAEASYGAVPTSSGKPRFVIESAEDGLGEINGPPEGEREHDRNQLLGDQPRGVQVGL